MLILVLFILAAENVYLAKNEKVESQDLIDSNDFKNAIAKELLKKKLLNLESARQQDSLAQFLRKGDKNLARGKPNFKVDDDPSRKQAQMANSFIASSNLLFGTKSQRRACNATNKPTNKETVLDMQSLRHSFSGYNEEGVDFPSSKDASNSSLRKRTPKRGMQDPISCYLTEPKKITCMHRDVIYKIQLPSSDVADDEIGRIVESIYRAVEGNRASIGKGAMEDSYKTKRASDDYIKSLFLNNLLLSSHPKTALMPTYNGNNAIYLPLIIPVSQSAAKAPLPYYPGLLVDPKLQMPYNLSISGGADALSDIGAIGRNILVDNGYGQYILPEGYFVSASNLHQRSENNLTADEEKRRNWLALMATNGYVPVESGINAKLANSAQPHLVDSIKSLSEGKETLGSSNKLTIADTGEYLDKLFNQRQERDTYYLRRQLRKNPNHFVDNSGRPDYLERLREKKPPALSNIIRNMEELSGGGKAMGSLCPCPCPCPPKPSCHTVKCTSKCTPRSTTKCIPRSTTTTTPQSTTTCTPQSTTKCTMTRHTSCQPPSTSVHTTTCPTCPSTFLTFPTTLPTFSTHPPTFFTFPTTCTPCPTHVPTTTCPPCSTTCPTCPTDPTPVDTTCPPCPTTHPTHSNTPCTTPSPTTECEECEALVAAHEAFSAAKGYQPIKPDTKLLTIQHGNNGLHYTSDAYSPSIPNQRQYPHSPQSAGTNTRESQKSGVYCKIVSHSQKDSPLSSNSSEAMDLKSKTHRDSFFSRLRSKFHKGILTNGSGSSNSSLDNRMQNKLHPIIRFNQGPPGQVWHGHISNEFPVSANPMKHAVSTSSNSQQPMSTFLNQTRSVFHINQPNQPNQPIIPITSPQPPTTNHTQPSVNQSQPYEYQSQPYGYQSQPYGYQSQPYGYQSQPYGYQSQPAGYQTQPQGSQSQPQGSPPQLQGSPPQPQGSQPQQQGFQPLPSGNQPQPQGSQPQQQGSQPLPSGNQPQPQGSQPQQQGSQPLPSGNQPQPQGSPPQPQRNQPQPQGSPPQLQGNQPQQQGCQPLLSGNQPQLQGSPPQPQGSPPQSQRIQPQPQGSQPRPTVSQPLPAWTPASPNAQSYSTISQSQSQSKLTIACYSTSQTQTSPNPATQSSSTTKQPAKPINLPNQTSNMKPSTSGYQRSQALKQNPYSPSQGLFYRRLLPQYVDRKLVQVGTDQFTAQFQPRSQPVSKLQRPTWQHSPSDENQWGIPPNQISQVPLWNQGQSFYQPSLNIPQMYPSQGIYETHLRIHPNIPSPSLEEDPNEVGHIVPQRTENSNHNVRLPRTSFKWGKKHKLIMKTSKLPVVKPQGSRGPRKIKWPLNHTSIYDKIARVRRYLQNRERQKRIKL